MSTSEHEETKKKSILEEIVGWVVYFAVIAFLAWVVITFIGQRTKVEGNSMNPTLNDGDQLIVDKLSYRFRTPQRYDIIVFPYQHREHTYYIKRIIGLPGETVQIIGGYVYIDGERLESDVYGAEVMQSAGIAEEPITLGDDEYFVLGDNRNHSSDSRVPDVGPLKRELLLGRAWVRIYPFDHMQFIRHK